ASGWGGKPRSLAARMLPPHRFSVHPSRPRRYHSRDRQPGGVMDLLEAKSRIAEALVESIFRRARYQVEAYPAGRTPLRFGREDFSPDFSATVPGQYGESSQEMLVEVKYRPSVEQSISVEKQPAEQPAFLLARSQCHTHDYI